MAYIIITDYCCLIENNYWKCSVRQQIISIKNVILLCYPHHILLVKNYFIYGCSHTSMCHSQCHHYLK